MTVMTASRKLWIHALLYSTRCKINFICKSLFSVWICVRPALFRDPLSVHLKRVLIFLSVISLSDVYTRVT